MTERYRYNQGKEGRDVNRRMERERDMIRLGKKDLISLRLIDIQIEIYR